MSETSSQVFSENRKNNGTITDRPVFREWAPLDFLNEKIPLRYHQGFVTKDLIYTCVAVSCDSIVIGSNAGVLFWFNRAVQHVIRKSIDERLTPVTAAALTLCQYGEALAVGNQLGTVAVFTSNSPHPAPVSFLFNQQKIPITALAWDGSGTHLLFGDQEGRVLLSKFSHGTLKLIKLVVAETSSIVQLRFHPLDNNTVLVSSLKRAVVAQINEPGAVHQVGQQERKQQASFGADFGYCCNETVIYSSRPGHRLWLSDCRGAVRQTMIFKESLSKPRSKLILLSFLEEYSNGDTSFGPVFCLSNGLILTYGQSSLFLLDPDSNDAGQVSVYTSSRFNTKALRHVTVFHNEIFLLLENRVLVRVSDRPDRSTSMTASLVSPAIDRSLLAGLKDKIPPVSPVLASTINKLANKISDADIKPLAAVGTNHGPYLIESLSNALAPLFDIKSVPITKAPPPKPLNPQFRPESASLKCDEQIPVPSIHVTRTSTPSNPVPVPFDSGSSAASSSSSTLDSPANSSESPPDEELVYGSYNTKKRKMKKSRKTNGVEDSVLPLESTATTQTEDNSQEPEPWKPPEIPTSNSDDLLEDLNRKDQLLAALLKLDQVSDPPNETPSDPPSDPVETESPRTDDTNETQELGIQGSQQVEEEPEAYEGETSDGEVSDDIYTKYAKEEEFLIDRNQNDALPSPTADPRAFEESVASSFTRALDDDSTMKQAEWLNCPLGGKRKVTSLAACQHYVVYVDNYKSVYYQSTESSFEARDWLFIDVPASQIAVTNSGQQLWRLYRGTAYQGSIVNVHCPVAQHWATVESYVSSIGIVQLDRGVSMEDYIWLLHSSGTLSCRSVRSPKKVTTVDVPGIVAQLCCQGDQVFILLTNGALYGRSRLAHQTPIGAGWQRLDAPFQIITMALGPAGHLWVLTRSAQLYFQAPDEKRWWQVSVLPTEKQLESVKWLKVTSVFKRYQFEMTVTNSRICLAVSGTSLLLTTTNLTGYAWEDIDWMFANTGHTVAMWRMVCATGFDTRNQSGVVWLMDRDNRLYCYYGDNMEQVSLPSENRIVQLAVMGQHMWLLTANGDVFIRAGNTSPVGTGWVQLSTLQFHPGNHLCHVALCYESAWACDHHSKIHYRSASNGPPTLLAPAWIPIEGPAICFRKIFASPNGRCVWAITRDGFVYFREGITSQLPIGTVWSRVYGIQACHMAVSKYSVWGLSPEGVVYRRLGISTTNFRGTSWEKAPGMFANITVTMDGMLWSINGRGIVYQLLTSSPLEENNKIRDETVQVDEDWVLL